MEIQIIQNKICEIREQKVMFMIVHSQIPVREFRSVEKKNATTRIFYRAKFPIGNLGVDVMFIFNIVYAVCTLFRLTLLDTHCVPN